MPPGQMVCSAVAFLAVNELEPILFKTVNLLKSKLLSAVQFLKEEDPKFSSMARFPEAVTELSAVQFSKALPSNEVVPGCKVRVVKKGLFLKAAEPIATLAELLLGQVMDVMAESSKQFAPKVRLLEAKEIVDNLLQPLNASLETFILVVVVEESSSSRLVQPLKALVPIVKVCVFSTGVMTLVIPETFLKASSPTPTSPV